jgi:hypothetical protein
MNITELIESLEQLKAERGNLAVQLEVNGMFFPIEAPVFKSLVSMTDDGFEDLESAVLVVPATFIGGGLDGGAQ